MRAQFLRAEDAAAFDNVAYCLMPDHVHKVMKARSATSDAKDYIKRAKQYSGFYYSRRFDNRLW